MRVIALFALVGCTAALAPEPPPAGALALSTPTWTCQSPDAIAQLPEQDVGVFGPLRLALRGYDQTATASTADATATIVPRSGTLTPLRLLGEQTGSRTLTWMLTPIGAYWLGSIVWADGTSDSGHVLYHLLDGGVLDATWKNPPAGVTLTVDLSAPPVAISDGIYALGAMRVRVVAGTAQVAANVLSIAPANGLAQVVVYSDPTLDSAPFDVAGALVTPHAGYVSERAGVVAESHVQFRSTILDIDQIMSIGDTAAAHVGPVLLADHAQIYVDAPQTSYGWRIGALAVKIVKTGPIGMRRMYYAYASPTGFDLSGQTFNFYVDSPRGTVTLWPVGRVTEPYRIAMKDRVVLVDFPSTDNDYSEDLGYDVMHTSTAWAWDDTTLVEAASLRATVDLTHTGEEGNSVDGGWRHVATGTLASFAVGGSNGFAAESVPTAAYRFDPGRAVQAQFSSFTLYHQRRAWLGAWADRSDDVAALRRDPLVYFGAVKHLHAGDVLAAGRTLDVAQVVRVTPTADDPSALFDTYDLPDGTPLRGALLDLDAGARPSASWDLAISGDDVGIVLAP